MLLDKNTINISFGAQINKLPKVLANAKQVKLKNLDNLNGYVGFLDADVYTPSNKLVKKNLLFKDGKLIAEKEYDERLIGKDEFRYVHLKNKVIAPSILDEHVHGGYGVNFNTAEEKDIRYCLRQMKKDGLGGIVATLLPEKPAVLNKRIELLNKIKKSQNPDEVKLYGIHLEGPFFSPKKPGIHPPEILMKPTVENFEELNSEGVKIVTIAPELDEGFKLTKYLKNHGIIPSAGHSAASAEELKKSGCTQVTHLFNAMPDLAHRDPLTITNEAISNNNISTEIIGSFEHVAPSVMNIPLTMKPKEKIILISDAIPAANTKKPFKMNGIDIFVDENGVAKSKTGVIAGNMEYLSQAAKKLIDNTVMNFEDFLRYASSNPAKNLGVQDEFKLEIGANPNFSIWDKITKTVEKVFTNNQQM